MNFQVSTLNFQSNPKFPIFKRLKILWKLDIGNWQLRKQGFTLLEMIVSIGIFTVLVISAIGLTIAISDAQIKTGNIQTTQDNIRFSLELITKEMRTGSDYALTTLGNGCGGTAEAGVPSEISFDTALREKRTYYLDTAANRIMRIVTGATTCTGDLDGDGNPDAIPFSAEDVFVDRLSFFVSGHALGPSDGQPKVTIVIKTRSKNPKIQLESSMDLQTTVVQRWRDL